MNKVTFFLLLLFTIFLIVGDPTRAGEIANSFFSWLGGLFDAFFEFIDALFGEGDTSRA